MIVISSVHLQKRKKIAKFGGYCSKNAPATPFRSLEWSRAWQDYFLSYHFQIWQKVEIFWVQKLVKIWCWYLKPLLSNWKLTKTYHSLYTTRGIFCTSGLLKYTSGCIGWSMNFDQIWITQEWFEISTSNFHKSMYS